MDVEGVKFQLEELIKDFKANYQQHRRELEANTETKLIEPLFSILGWTTKDFVKREQARRGRRQGFVDYAFKVDGRTVFMLEAKKLDVELEKEADTQVISYALSRRVPIAISTNFESLKIFCVEQENAVNNVFRVFKSPDEYINNLQDLLYLHKESFEQNLIMKKAEDEGRLRKRTSIDEPLLEDLMRIRNMIANDIQKRYPGRYDLNEREEIIQRVIDRLIFIRKCEDVGINPEDVTLEKITHEPYGRAYSELKDIFSQYNEIYNGGLFASGVDNDCDKITIDGEITQKLISLLYESKDGQYIYNFDWIDADVLGQIYEQYLGKILAQTESGKSKLTNGQAHRKEQGIYYTPTYIVDCIVDNTIGVIAKEKKKDVRRLRILDPACGSGSFLIRAFDRLRDRAYSYDESKMRRLDEQGMYSVKTSILKNNLYGVDIDPKAVEITKLNLLLKAAEKNRKLPIELDLHIRYGNSLIDRHELEDAAFEWIGDFEKGTFDVVIGNPPYIGWDSIDRRDRVLFETGSYLGLDYACRPNHRDSQPNYYLFFLVRAESLLSDDGMLSFILPQEWLNHNYAQSFRNRLLDSFGRIDIIQFHADFKVFHGSDKTVGTNSLIITLHKKGSKKITHRYVGELDENKVRRILNEGRFEKETITPFRDAYDKSWSFIEPGLDRIRKKIATDSIEFSNKEFFIVCGGFQPPVNAARHFELSESDYSELNRREREVVFRLAYESNEIGRYVVTGALRYWIVANDIETEQEFKNSCPNLFVILHDRLAENMKNTWWHFPNIRNFDLIKGSSTKILSPRTASEPTFALDEERTVFKGTNTAIVSKVLSTKYVVALLNSKLSDFWYTYFGCDYHGGKTKKYEPDKARRHLIPIRMATEEQQKDLADLTDRMIGLHRQLARFGEKRTTERARIEMEIKRIDSDIDDKVYRLYGLTKREIEMVESQEIT